MNENDLLKHINKPPKNDNRDKLIIIIIFCLSLLFALSRLNASTKDDILDFASQLSKFYNIPEHIVPALIQVESEFVEAAVSEKGAYNVMQVTFDAYTDYTNLVKDYKVKSWEDAKNSWISNMAVGTWYLKVRCYNDDWKIALTKYFWGPSHSNTTENYYNKVSKHF